LRAPDEFLALLGESNRIKHRVKMVKVVEELPDVFAL
jgi:hypothetical protein